METEKQLTEEDKKRIEAIFEKYPVLRILKSQGVTYETMPESHIKRLIEKEIGIEGWKLVPVRKEE